MDQLAGLVVEVFGNQFSVEDVNGRTDIGEMMLALNQIIARAAVLSQKRRLRGSRRPSTGGALLVGV